LGTALFGLILFSLAAYGLARRFLPLWTQQAHQFEQVFANNPQPMLIYDPASSQLLAVNASAQQLYQYSEAELLRFHLHDIQPEAPSPRVQDLMAPQVRAEHAGLIRHRRKDGSIFMAHAIANPIAYQGRTACLLMVRNVDELVQKAQEVRELNRRLGEFRFAIERATIMGLIDAEGKFLEVNENMVETTGYPKVDLVGQSFAQSFAPEEAGKFERILAALHGHRIWRGEIHHQKPSGEAFWTQSFFIPFNPQKDQLAQAIVIYTDITERKRSEETAKRREGYLRSMVNSQSNYVIRSDQEGNYTFVNERFREKFYYLAPDGDFVGVPTSDTFLEEDHPAVYQMVMDCMQHPQKVNYITIRKPDGQGGIIWTEWEFVGIQDEQGEVVEIQGIGQDITERLVNEQHIQQQNDIFKEIAWLSSHELRRPVANILGLIYLLRDTYPEEAEQVIEMLSNSATDLDQLVQGIVEKAYEAELSAKVDLNELFSPETKGDRA